MTAAGRCREGVCRRPWCQSLGKPQKAPFRTFFIRYLYVAPKLRSLDLLNARMHPALFPQVFISNLHSVRPRENVGILRCPQSD